MGKVSWVFPGQGSQASGMGSDLCEVAFAREKFAQAEEALGWCVNKKSQCSDEELAQTEYTQPCLYTIESILVDLLKEKGLSCDYAAGHSLGEYVALYAAGVFDFATGLELVKKRSQIMSQVKGGQMAALMKFDRSQLDSLIEKSEEVVIANDNSADQVVVSGTPAGIEAILSQVKAKRSILLKVSGAFHSPYMNDAANEFGDILEQIEFKSAQFPVFSNVDPTPSKDPVILKQRLKKQMTGSVRWLETMQEMSRLDVAEVVEIGPGKVLTGLFKRTTPEIALKNISALNDMV
jgi:[acyl-carrier-protein] S-malonyltransferase